MYWKQMEWRTANVLLIEMKWIMHVGEPASVCERTHEMKAASLCLYVVREESGGSLLVKSWLTLCRDKHKSDWQKQSGVGAECWSAEEMQSRVCRPWIKWVEHAATPGPRLKSRLAEWQKQKLSHSKVSVCLLFVCTATSVQSFFCLYLGFSTIICTDQMCWGGGGGWVNTTVANVMQFCLCQVQ